MDHTLVALIIVGICFIALAVWCGLKFADLECDIRSLNNQMDNTVGRTSFDTLWNTVRDNENRRWAVNDALLRHMNLTLHIDRLPASKERWTAEVTKIPRTR